MKPANLTLSIVIPCYNEANRLAKTVEEMLAQVPALVDSKFEIILVDDGSIDQTIDIAEGLIARTPTHIRLVRHPHNRGKGAAVRTGVGESRGEYTLMADADGSTPITEVRKLLAEARNGVDIVIGSRAMDDESVLLKTRIHRRVLGRLFNGIVNLLVLPGIRDTQCGFKMFSRRAVTELFPDLKVDHFGFDIELLFQGRIKGLSISELPVNWHHVEGSKVNLVTDSAQMLGMAIIMYGKHLVSGKRISKKSNGIGHRSP